MIRLAVNGYGRIGRSVLRLLHAPGGRRDAAVVAINEPSDLEAMAHLTRFDSTHGPFPAEVRTASGGLRIDGHPIAVHHSREPEAVDWAALGADVVVECSGAFSDRATATRYLDAGAPRLLLSHPMRDAEAVDATVIMGVNEGTLGGAQRLVSTGSCTTNCVVPVLACLDRALGVEAATLTTIHAAMNDQPVLDGYHHRDPNRNRSAMNSIVPVATGLARGVERLLPNLAGRVQAQHYRVPTLNVSVMDLTLQLASSASADALNQRLHDASAGPLRGILGVTDTPQVSVDFNADTRSAVLDANQTRVAGKLAHLSLWFDNEHGFASRMIDAAVHWANAIQSEGRP